MYNIACGNWGYERLNFVALMPPLIRPFGFGTEKHREPTEVSAKRMPRNCLSLGKELLTKLLKVSIVVFACQVLCEDKGAAAAGRLAAKIKRMRTFYKPNQTMWRIGGVLAYHEAEIPIYIYID